MNNRQFSAVTVRHKKILFCLAAALALLTSVLDRHFASAQFSIGSGQSCSSRGQIRDFQAQRFICLKVNAKAGSASGPSLVWVKISSPKSTTKVTTTTVSVTSTTIKKSCQEGGICKIGDRGPGGGFVFYVNPDKSSTGWEFLEFAPSCVNYSHYPADKIQLDGIAKFPNNYKPSCPWFSNYQVLAAVDAYYTETKDDWILPSREQLKLALQNLYLQANPPLIMANCVSEPNHQNCDTYRTSTSDKPDWYWCVGVSYWGTYKGKAISEWEMGCGGGALRPIRSFNAVSP